MLLLLLQQLPTPCYCYYRGSVVDSVLAENDDVRTPKAPAGLLEYTSPELLYPSLDDYSLTA